MTVLGDRFRRIAGVIDQDFLGNEKDPAGGLETSDVKRTILITKLHQVDTGQVASRIIQEHVFRAGIAGINATGVWTGMPAINGGVILHTRITTLPGTFGHAGH